MKKIIVLLIVTICIFCSLSFTGCAKNNKTNPIVEFTFSTGDTVRVELFPDAAPITVENFLKYVKDDFYVGISFHRIIKGFMVQTGGFVFENGIFVQKEATYPAIYGEFENNGCSYNKTEHLKGTIAMARSSANSATSQFFFSTVDNYPSLKGEYAAFGRVIDEESMNALYKFESVLTTTGKFSYGSVIRWDSDVPTQLITITKTTVIKE